MKREASFRLTFKNAQKKKKSTSKLILPFQRRTTYPKTLISDQTNLKFSVCRVKGLTPDVIA